MKRCIYCGYVQPLKWFPKNRLAPDGHQNICKKCDRANSRIDYIMNKAKRDEKNKLWQDNNYYTHLDHTKKYSKTEAGKESHRRYYKKKAQLKRDTEKIFKSIDR